MICDVFGLVINVPLSYVMVFGKLGFPALGIVGAGVSTVVSTILAFLLFLAFYFGKEHRDRFAVRRSFSLDLKILRRFWRLGFPSGLEMFLNECRCIQPVPAHVPVLRGCRGCRGGYRFQLGYSLFRSDDRAERRRHQSHRPFRRRSRHGAHQ
jgi:hypothetical protein